MEILLVTIFSYNLQIVLQPDTLHDLSRLIMAELRRLAFQVSEEEVARARNQVDGSVLSFLHCVHFSC
jgi:processing peptidase subunit beta